MAFFQRLQDWQDLKGVKDAALAEMIDCDRSVLSRAKRGIHMLKMRHQLKLEAVSGIKPSEWAEFYASIEAAKATPEKKSRKPAAIEGVA